MTKAGAYAIQGRAGRFIRGSRLLTTTSVGLPLEHLLAALRELLGLDENDTNVVQAPSLATLYAWAAALLAKNNGSVPGNGAPRLACFQIFRDLL